MALIFIMQAISISNKCNSFENF